MITTFGHNFRKDNLSNEFFTPTINIAVLKFNYRIKRIFVIVCNNQVKGFIKYPKG